MEIRQVSDSVSIYSDGKRLQVIHDLGDEFILDLNILVEDTFNINGQMLEAISVIEPVFKVSGFCSKIGEGCIAYAGLSCNLMNLSDISRSIRMICLIGGKIQGVSKCYFLAT